MELNELSKFDDLNEEEQKKIIEIFEVKIVEDLSKEIENKVKIKYKAMEKARNCTYANYYYGDHVVDLSVIRRRILIDRITNQMNKFTEIRNKIEKEDVNSKAIGYWSGGAEAYRSILYMFEENGY